MQRVSDGPMWPESWADEWPVNWIQGPDRQAQPQVCAFRLEFELDQAATVPLFVTADQRFWLFVDGVWRGCGPERGDALNWFVQRSAVPLDAGRHVLGALVWSLAPGDAPAAQITVRPGFLLASLEPWLERIGTGLAPWQCRAVGGVTAERSTANGPSFLAGSNVRVDAAGWPWGWEDLDGSGVAGWEPAHAAGPGRSRPSTRDWGSIGGTFVRPATLPEPELNPWNQGTVRHVDEPGSLSGEDDAVQAARHLAPESAAWETLVRGGSVTVPPGARRRMVLDLTDYVCGYPEIQVDGGHGAEVRIAWAESLFERWGYDGAKGNRNNIEGKTFYGRGDVFVADGGDGRLFRPLWWGCGRFVQISVECRGQAVRLSRWRIRETRTPMERADALNLWHDGWARASQIMWRTLQACAHETFMDCPYYEQLQYAGDTRLQMLVTYVTQRDDRMARKAIEMLASSQLPNGLTRSNYPCRGGQLIPQFALFWVTMLHDFALWRGDRAFIRAQLPAMRRVLETFATRIDDEGRIAWPDGWNWVDWSDDWRKGVTTQDGGHSPLGPGGWSGINHLQWVMVTRLAAELERWVGEPSCAARWDGAGDRVMDAARRLFWDQDRMMFADDTAHRHVSQHAQAYAVLTGRLTDLERSAVVDAMVRGAGLARASVYFEHYVFEALARAGQAAQIADRLQLWLGLDAQGFCTVFERPEPSRSDCHAWGAHPLFHGHASLLGIRPAGFGFESVTIRPAASLAGPVSGRMPHPAGGWIEVTLDRGIEVRLPEGIGGTLHWQGAVIALEPGCVYLTEGRG